MIGTAICQKCIISTSEIIIRLVRIKTPLLRPLDILNYLAHQYRNFVHIVFKTREMDYEEKKKKLP